MIQADGDGNVCDKILKPYGLFRCGKKNLDQQQGPKHSRTEHHRTRCRGVTVNCIIGREFAVTTIYTLGGWVFVVDVTREGGKGKGQRNIRNSHFIFNTRGTAGGSKGAKARQGLNPLVLFSIKNKLLQNMQSSPYQYQFLERQNVRTRYVSRLMKNLTLNWLFFRMLVL